MQQVQLENQTITEVKPKSIRRKAKSGAIVTYDKNETPVHISNVLDARGITCTGKILKNSNKYQNTILVEDEFDGMVHVIHKSQLDVELGHPNRKRDTHGNSYNGGGFEQPLQPVGDRDPGIKQERRTGFT